MTKGRAHCRALARSSINMLRLGAVGEAGPAPSPAPVRALRIVFVAVVLAAIAGVLAMSPAPARQFWLGFARPLRGVKPRLWAEVAASFLITDQRLELLGVLDPARDGIHRGQDADQSTLGIHLSHDLGELLRIAIAKFVDGAHAGGAQELRIFPADAFDAHAVGGSHPIEYAFLRCAGLERDLQPLFRRFRQAQQAYGRTNAIGFQNGGDIGADPLNFGNGIRHPCPLSAGTISPEQTFWYSNKLRKAGNCRHNLADGVFACLLSRERDHRAGHALHLTEAQTGR